MEFKKSAEDILNDLRSRDEKYLYKGTYIRWGLVQKDLSAAHARVIESLKKENDLKDTWVKHHQKSVELSLKRETLLQDKLDIVISTLEECIDEEESLRFSRILRELVSKIGKIR